MLEDFFNYINVPNEWKRKSLRYLERSLDFVIKTRCPLFLIKHALTLTQKGIISVGFSRLWMFCIEEKVNGKVWLFSNFTNTLAGLVSRYVRIIRIILIIMKNKNTKTHKYTNDKIMINVNYNSVIVFKRYSRAYLNYLLHLCIYMYTQKSINFQILIRIKKTVDPIIDISTSMNMIVCKTDKHFLKETFYFNWR